MFCSEDQSGISKTARDENRVRRNYDSGWNWDGTMLRGAYPKYRYCPGTLIQRDIAAVFKYLAVLVPRKPSKLIALHRTRRPDGMAVQLLQRSYRVILLLKLALTMFLVQIYTSGEIQSSPSKIVVGNVGNEGRFSPYTSFIVLGKSLVESRDL